MEKNNNLSFVIDTTNTISVDDFSKSLVALNDEFKRLNGGHKELRIEKIREGSYIVEFIVDTICATLPLLSDTNIILDFLSHLKNIKEYILGNKQAESQITEKSIENTSYIVQPIVNCGSNCTININYGEQNVKFTQKESQIIEDKTPSLIKKTGIKEELETSNLRKKVLFRWYQTCFDKNKVNKGNKGIIDNILPQMPISVIFEDDSSEAKKEMTTSRDGIDWQRRGYIVDVEILKVGDRIIKYKIINNYPNESVPNLFDLFD